MKEKILSFETSLLKLNPESDDYIFEVEDLIESTDEKTHDLLIPSIFKFFEKNTESDCGSPGALVHLIEGFYPNYKSLLLNSLSKTPNYVSILMVNRILNAELTEDEHAEYIQSLKTILLKQDVSPFLKEEAQGVIEYHLN